MKWSSSRHFGFSHLRLLMTAGLLVTLLLPLSSSASPFEVIVNVKGWLYCGQNDDVSKAVQVPAGTFELIPIGPSEGGIYVSENPWGGVVIDCDENGANCRKGWLWNVHYSIDGGLARHFGESGIFATPEQALEAARPLTITLDQPAELRFWSQDDVCSDNHGGFSFRIQVGTSAPTEQISWSRVKGLYR